MVVPNILYQVRSSCAGFVGRLKIDNAAHTRACNGSSRRPTQGGADVTRSRNHWGFSRRQVLSGAGRLERWRRRASNAACTCNTALEQRGTGPSVRRARAVTARTQLVLLGTQGGPNVNLQRAQMATHCRQRRRYLVACVYGP